MQNTNFKIQNSKSKVPSSESKVKSFKSKDSKIAFLKKARVEGILKSR